MLRLSRQTLQELLTKALAREWTPAQSAILACTDGTESVAQAVARVRQGGAAPQVSGHGLLGCSSPGLIAPAMLRQHGVDVGC